MPSSWVKRGSVGKETGWMVYAALPDWAAATVPVALERTPAANTRLAKVEAIRALFTGVDLVRLGCPQSPARPPPPTGSYPPDRACLSPPRRDKHPLSLSQGEGAGG